MSARADKALQREPRNGQNRMSTSSSPSTHGWGCITPLSHAVAPFLLLKILLQRHVDGRPPITAVTTVGISLSGSSSQHHAQRPHEVS
jgi:hypothetical protein